MDFSNSETEADSGDDNDEQDFGLSDDGDLIDNSSNISKRFCDHYAFQNVETDVDEVLKELDKK